MADPRPPTLLAAWVELATTIADYQPDRPMDVDLPRRLLTLLLWPLGPRDAGHCADVLLDLAPTRWHTTYADEYYTGTLQRTVAALIAAVRRSETPLAGVSPATAGEGATGTGEGHTAVPVTPTTPDVEVVYLRETGGHAWRCNNCGGSSYWTDSSLEGAIRAAGWHRCAPTAGGEHDA